MTALDRTLNAELTGFAALREKITTTLTVWRKRVQNRHQLEELSFRDIQEIGVDQALVEQEIAKPFWRA